jgi:hypothetical protein
VYSAVRLFAIATTTTLSDIGFDDELRASLG